jgi:hypothetical protein
MDALKSLPPYKITKHFKIKFLNKMQVEIKIEIEIEITK